MPHAALWVVQPYGIENVSVRRECFNAARGFVGGAASLRKHTKSLHLFQCRTRLCGWCSCVRKYHLLSLLHVSMPHAALWVVQQVAAYLGSGFIPVSMPHAALWVVQLTTLVVSSGAQSGFNAARGFVGGAA